MVVVPHRPWRRLFFVLMLVVGVAASAFGGFMYGYYEAVLTQETVQAAEEELNQELTELRARNAELQREVTILDRSSVMDQRANEEVREPKRE